MIKRTFLNTAAAFLIAAVPTAAFAQDGEVDADSEESVDDADSEEASDEEAEEQTSLASLFFPDINYDVDDDPDTIWVLDLSNGERVKIRLMKDWAPGHVDRIQTLTREGFYDGIVFHRVGRVHGARRGSNRHGPGRLGAA